MLSCGAEVLKSPHGHTCHHIHPLDLCLLSSFLSPSAILALALLICYSPHQIFYVFSLWLVNTRIYANFKICKLAHWYTLELRKMKWELRQLEQVWHCAHNETTRTFYRTYMRSYEVAMKATKRLLCDLHCICKLSPI